MRGIKANNASMKYISLLSNNGPHHLGNEKDVSVPAPDPSTSPMKESVRAVTLKPSRTDELKAASIEGPPDVSHHSQ